MEAGDVGGSPVQEPGPEEEQGAGPGRKKESAEAPAMAAGSKDPEGVSGGPGRRKAVPFHRLFRFADAQDWGLMLLGTTGAVLDGLSLPVMLLVMGGLINSFGENSQAVMPDFMGEIRKYTKAFTYIAIGTMVACYLEAACWMRTGERQTSRIRHKYLRAILRQDVSFFDLAGTSTAEVVNSVAVDSMVFQETLAEKIAHFVMNIAGFIGGYAVAFFLAPKMAAFILAFSPLLIVPGVLYGRTLMQLSRKLQQQYVKAGAVAEQALSAIRTVYSFVGEKRSSSDYSAALAETVRLGQQQGLAKGLAIGFTGVSYLIWAFAAFYGARLSINEGVSGGKIVATGLASMVGGLDLGLALPDLRYFAEAAAAAATMFSMFDRVPAIDSDNPAGTQLEKVQGELELKGVEFRYPSRPDTIVFQDMSLVIPAGQTVALVGGSGSGKSTVVALLERLYDPAAGEVLLDGVNIKNVQLKWLRLQIGLVSQEPALFATSIMENILLGKEGATEEEAMAAARASNAHDFISMLPAGYNTQVGERGVQMSGGQKQRIAIARALLRKPPILLLDEATSALDAESERVVQAALDSAALGRTTVVVAHRLSTIRHAHKIAVVQAGRVVETGRHDELVTREGGAYAALVRLQHTRASQKELHDEIARVSSARISSIGPRLSSHRISSARLSSTRLSNARPSNARDGSFAVDEVEVSPPEEDNAPPKPPSFKRLLALNKPEWKHAVLGCAGAAGAGFVQPLYALLLGTLVSVFYYTDKEREKRTVSKFAGGFAALFVGSLLVNLLQHYNLQAMGEKLTRRVREMVLEKVMTFEVGWFDEEENSSGAVCARLSSEANVVRALVGDRVALVVQVMAAVLFSAAVGLVVAWKLSLVMIAIQPFVVLAYYGKKMLLKSESGMAMQAQQESSALASEAVCNHRTITAFCAQDRIVGLFDAMQDGLRKESVFRANVAGVGLGLAQFTLYATWAVDFYYGGKLVNDGEISFRAMFICFFVLVSTGRIIADAGSMTSDIAKGAGAVAVLFAILDRKTLIDPEGQGEKVEKVSGHIEVKDVDFAYPARPDIMIFRNFSLKVRAGTNVALVGQSGSGKSTIIGLIERFYDPLRGKVKIDGKDIATLHLRTLRRHIALVGQEPTLFAGSIRENILYGRENATEAEVVEAAKAANAHDFISALAHGYDTSTGERGLQLSGGQKQRIAIARAIIKNPAILLLDEATSALDAQSEKVVQDALDRIMVGRTTIVVAHRLTTIQNAASIAVLQDGAILEQGRHKELMEKGESGAYYQLVQVQSNMVVET